MIIHYLMDGLRHGEYFDSRVAKVRDAWWKVALDILTPIIVILIFIYVRNPKETQLFNILLGVFFSMLPDGLTLLHWKYPKNKILARIKKFHEIFHNYKKWPKFSSERQWNLRNATNDILISIIAIILLFF